MPIAEPRIRRATVEDAAAIARVRVDTWRSAYRGILPDELLDGLDPAESAVRWRRGLETLNPDRVAYVADAGGAIVGEKSEPYEGHVLNEVGYGWRDPAALIGAPAR